MKQRPLRPKFIQAERVGPFTGRSTDIGVVLDLMIHDIDLLLDLVGAPVQSVAEMIAHEQTQALGLLQQVPDSAMKFVGLPISFDGLRPALRRRPPKLGEHTDECLKKVK